MMTSSASAQSLFLSQGDPVLVEDGDIPDTFLAEARQRRLVAIDIETTGLKPTQEKIGACQLFMEGGPVHIVRPRRRPPVLMALLGDPQVCKVFHYALFDLSFMRFHWQAEARNVWCTKIASRVLSPARMEHSLASLLAQYLGVNLEKDQSIRTSDWTAGSLSPAQIAYAARDVLHLPKLMSALDLELRRLGRDHFAQAAFEFLPFNVELQLMGVVNVFAY